MSDVDLSALTDSELKSLEAQVVQTGAAGVQGKHVGVQPTPGIGYRREYDPSSEEFQQTYGPLAGQGPGAKTWLGVQQGVHEVGRQIGNLTGLESNEALREAQRLDQPLSSTPEGKFGSLVGQTLPLALGTSGLASGLARLGLKAPALVSSTLAGAGQGALMGGPDNRLGGALGGGTAGFVLPVGASALQKLTYGLSRTPAAQRLIDEGLVPTPGQLNPAGVMNQFEQSGESLPGAKQIIEPAREATERGYQALIMQKASAPGAPKIKPSENISDMLQQAQDSYAPLYDQAKGYPISAKPLGAQFTQAARTPGVPKSLQASEGEWLQDRLSQLPKNPQSEDLLDLRSAIRARARVANLKTDIDSGHVANINSRAEQAVTSQLNSQLPSPALQALKTADANYGNYKIVENAVASSKDNLAGLTPQKLSQAVFNATGDPAYAMGAGGPLRDLAKTGTEVFQNVSPPTGARLVPLSAALLGIQHPQIGIPAAAAGLGLVGTETGRRLAAGVTPGQKAAQALGEMLSRYSPPGSKEALQTAFNVGAGPSLQNVPAMVLARAMASIHKPESALVPQYREGSQ